MKRIKKLLLSSLILTILVLATTPILLSQNQTLAQVADTSPALISQSQYIGPAPSNLKIIVMIVPQLRLSALAQYIQNLYNPSSPDYHKFLNPFQIYFNFSYSPITPDVISYASQFGIKVNATVPLFPELIGTIGQFEQMFHVQFGMYKYGNMIYYAPSQNVEMPISIAPYISTILGLNNITIAYPLINYIAEYKIINGTPQLINQTKIEIKPGQYFAPYPVYQYTPLQLEGAYGLLPLYKLGFYGQGETIAIVDAYGNPNISQALNFFDENYSHLPNPPLFNVLYYNATQLPSPNFGWGVETSLDVEYAHTMAPGANILLVYTPYPNNELFSAVAFILEYHLANVISLSWGAPEYYLLQSGVNVSALNAIFETAVAEGVQVFVSSGDSGVYDSLQGLHSVNFPASSPYVTAVGGTGLFMKGVSSYVNATMQYLYQIGWGDYFANYTADGYTFITHYSYAGSGGGQSEIFKQPFYQSGLPYTNRTNPDIALDADPFTGVNVIIGPWTMVGGVGGTSLAAPLAAGIAAIIDQYYNNTLGFLNPYLYRLYFMSDKVPYNYAFLTTYANSPGYIAGQFEDFWPNGLIVTGAEVYAVLGNDTGYFATPNQYNFVTGLGSINAYELLTLINTNGTALYLSGNGYAYSSSAVPMTGQLTVSFWLNITAYPSQVGKTYLSIVGNAGGSTSTINAYSWGIFLRNNGSIQLNIMTGNSGVYIIDSRVPIPVGKLTLVTVTYNNATGQANIYFNGTLVASATLPSIPLKSYTVYIGNVLTGFSGIGLLRGQIVNLQIYDAVLPQQDVQALYLANVYGKPIAGMNLVSWALMEQTTGSTIYSQVGPGYILTGTYSWSPVYGFVPTPQYLGLINFTYNIYSQPILI